MKTTLRDALPPEQARALETLRAILLIRSKAAAVEESFAAANHPRRQRARKRWQGKASRRGARR